MANPQPTDDPVTTEDVVDVTLAPVPDVELPVLDRNDFPDLAIGAPDEGCDNAQPIGIFNDREGFGGEVFEGTTPDGTPCFFFQTAIPSTGDDPATTTAVEVPTTGLPETGTGEMVGFSIIAILLITCGFAARRVARKAPSHSQASDVTVGSNA